MTHEGAAGWGRNGCLGSVLVFALLLFSGSSMPANAQGLDWPGPQAGHSASQVSPWEDPPADPSRSWWSLWSAASGHDRVFLGMWSFHPLGNEPFRWETNNGLGVQLRSLFAFTCVNSFDRRTYAAGLERRWVETRRGSLGVMLGFRVGLIRGYDSELLQIAGETHVLPFAGTVALIRLGPVGGEISWVYRAVSLVGAVFL